jgi:pimeloyl-ACP methyl ester carboxylesterase
MTPRRRHTPKEAVIARHRLCAARCGAPLLAAAIVGTLQACAPTAPAQTTLDLTPCAAVGGADALCGRLAVPEDPAAPEGRRIELAITVLPATGPDRVRAPDPVFALHGGPGAAAAFLAPVFAAQPLRNRRDVVLVDQRGTGGSNGMRCGTADPYTWLVAVLGFDFAPSACDDFEADPRLYTTPIAMDDLDAVRAALGYEHINLWGGSYGSRAALVYLRRHPERVRTAVLDGVAPPSVLVPVSFPRTSQAAFELLLDDCRADPNCREGGDPSALLTETLALLAAAPSQVTVPFPGESQPVTIPFGPIELAGSILYALYSPFTAAGIPSAIRAAHSGDYAPAAAFGTAFAAGTRPAFAIGMTLSVLCAEDVPYFTDAEMKAAAEGTFLGEGFADGLHEACAAWPSGTVPDGYHDPVDSPVPTLLLSGEGDPVTPPEFAARAAAALPQSRHVVFPDMGHGQTASACGAALVAAFLDAGTVEGLDTSCVAQVVRPPFPG